MTDSKVLTFKDEFNNINEEISRTVSTDTNNTTNLKGVVKFINPDTGETIFEKENLIVLRGRTFALEKLFGVPITGSPYIQNLNRSVALFKIGKGGTPEGDPFNPIVPEYFHTSLSDEVPFITVDPNKLTSGDIEKASNPSIVTELSIDQQHKYYMPVVDTLDPEVTHYYGKNFEDAEWVFDEVNNEVYRELSLFISAIDARGKYINELGLFIAEYDEVNNEYLNLELFSKLTFDTEPLSNNTKSILIQYRIYA